MELSSLDKVIIITIITIIIIIIIIIIIANWNSKLNSWHSWNSFELSFSGNWTFYRVQQDKTLYNMRCTMQNNRVDNDNDKDNDTDDDDDNDNDNDDDIENYDNKTSRNWKTTSL